MQESTTFPDIQTRNKKIAKKLQKKEQEGFKYGELNSFMKKLAAENNTTFYTVRNIYYNHVKEEEETPIPKAEQIDEFDVSGKLIRIVNFKGNAYFVLLDICEALGINRNSNYIRKGIKNLATETSFVKAKEGNGQANSTILLSSNIMELVDFILDNHVNSNIKKNAKLLISRLKELGYNLNHENKQETTVQDNVEEPTSTEYKEETSEFVGEKQLSAIQPLNKSIENQEPSYSYGEDVKVRIAHIVPYGVLVETMDKHSVQGLIHIKNVRKSYVPDLKLYFAVGDELEAKVMRFDKKNNRLNLSTSHLALSLKQNLTNENSLEGVAEEVENEEETFETVLANKLGPLKEKITFSEEPVQPIKKSSPSAEPIIQSDDSDDNDSVNKESAELPTEPSKVSVSKEDLFNLEIQGNKELDKIVTILNKKVGALTPSARVKLLDILNRDDVTLVDFILSMSDAIANFQPDLGLILLKEIENKLSDGL